MAPIIPRADRSFHNDPMEDRRSRVETAGEIGDVLDPPVTRRPSVERARPRRCYTSMMNSAAPRRIRERDHQLCATLLTTRCPLRIRVNHSLQSP